MAKKNKFKDLTFLDIVYSVAGQQVPASIILLLESVEEKFYTDTEKEVMKLVMTSYKRDGIFPTYDFISHKFNLIGERICKSTSDLKTAVAEIISTRQQDLLTGELSDISVQAQSAEELSDKVHEALDKHRPTRKKYELQKSSKSVYEAEKLLPPGVKYGISCIDSLTSGAQPGTVGCIAGYTTHGKSTFVNNGVYLNGYAGRKIAVVSLEIPKQLAYYIYLSRHSKNLGKLPISYESIIKKELTVEEEKYLWNVVEPDFLNTVGKNVLILDSSDIVSYTKNGIKATYKMAEETLGGLDEVVWDHVNQFLYLNPNSGLTGNHYIYWISEVSKEFRTEKGNLVTSLFAVQCNRDGWRKAKRNNGQYDMTALSDFNEIERSCTYVVFVYADEQMREANNAKVQLVKHRIGRVMIDPEVVDVLFAYAAVEKEFKNTISNVSIEREDIMIKDFISTHGDMFEFGEGTKNQISNIMNELLTACKDSIDDNFIYHTNNAYWGSYILIMEKRGLSFVRVYQFKEDNKTVYLDMLSVSEELRHKGVGNTLLEMCEKIGRNLGVSIISLYVLSDSWMHEWYKRKGYVDYQNHNENMIWMNKSLI